MIFSASHNPPQPIEKFCYQPQILEVSFIVQNANAIIQISYCGLHILLLTGNLCQGPAEPTGGRPGTTQLIQQLSPSPLASSTMRDGWGCFPNTWHGPEIVQVLRFLVFSHKIKSKTTREGGKTYTELLTSMQDILCSL